VFVFKCTAFQLCGYIHHFFKSCWCHWITFCLKLFWVLTPEFVFRRNSGCLSWLLLRSGMCWHDSPSACCTARRAMFLWQSDSYSDFQNAQKWPKWNSQCVPDFTVFEDKFLHCLHISICIAYHWCIFSPGDTAFKLGKPLRNVCSSHFLLYKFLKMPYYFFSSASKMWCRHTVVPSVQVSRYAKISNGTACACT
jgi:hypothetical protein